MANFIKNFIEKRRYKKQVRGNYKKAKRNLATFVSANDNPDDVTSCVKWCFRNTEDGLSATLKIEYCQCFDINPFEHTCCVTDCPMYKRYTDFYNASKAVQSLLPETFEDIEKIERMKVEIIESVKFKKR
ncbi:MAG: hypothetical protein J6W40_03455 [Alphaproteobacteria bacterium]|nr:hypothetical protein [Alphaproteobacteria bacterium]